MSVLYVIALAFQVVVVVIRKAASASRAPQVAAMAVVVQGKTQTQ